MTKSYMVIDGQWGSTGKGLIAGYLALTRKPDTAVCNYGTNAGHTVVLDDGRVVMTQMLPSAIVSPSVKNILIGPGAVIDPEILMAEIEKYADLLKGKNIYVHESAALIGDIHKYREKNQLNRVSSTCKGVGAAQADKIMRIAGCTVGNSHRSFEGNVKVVSVMEFTDLLLESKVLQIESAQGLELGLNSGGWYPYCTSRDVNICQVFSDCGIPYCMDKPEIVVTMRTFPIRVGDAFDASGNKIGTSGPVYDDQREITWEELGVPLERTTVTHKIRRVFTWSDKNFEKVLKLLAPDYIFLNFINYLKDENPSFESPNVKKFIENMEDVIDSLSSKAIVKWAGIGPKIKDVLER